MKCSYDGKCPYEKQCGDCMYRESAVRKNTKTGLDTSDMRQYKRDYMRSIRERSLQAELQRIGLA